MTLDFYDDAGVGPNAVIAEQWITPTFAPEIAESNWGETFQYGGLFSSTLNVNLNPGKVWISVSAKIEGDQLWYGGAFEPNTLEGVIDLCVHGAGVVDDGGCGADQKAVIRTTVTAKSLFDRDE